MLWISFPVTIGTIFLVGGSGVEDKR